MQIVGEQGVRVIPEIMVGTGSGGGTSGGMIEALLGILLRREIAENREQPSKPVVNGDTPKIEITKE
jgi:hypothetical protein